jgi:uncharacterized protein YktA (UPF0223 family)
MHCYNTRLQAAHKKTSTPIAHQTRPQARPFRETTINTIQALLNRCHSQPTGANRIDMIISLYKYLLTCTEFIKSYQRFREIVEEKSYEFLDQISFEIEKAFQGEYDLDHENKLYELEDVINEYLDKIDM